MDDGAPDTRPPEPVKGERIATARFGTLCSNCSYDLRGQPVVNERHYRMNVVACPECAAVMPYGPRYRGRKAECRRAAIVVFAWLLLMILLVLGVAGSLMALAQSTAFASSVPLSGEISHRYDSTLPRTHRGMTFQSTHDRHSPWEEIDVEWWAAHERDIIESQGGWTGAADWIVLTDLLYLIPISLGLAMLWRVLFMHTHRLVSSICVVCALAIGAGMLGLYFLATGFTVLGHLRRAIYLAEDHVGVPVAWLSYAVGCVSFLAMLPIAGVALRVVATRIAPPSIRAKLWKFDPAVPR